MNTIQLNNFKGFLLYRAKELSAEIKTHNMRTPDDHIEYARCDGRILELNTIIGEFLLIESNA